MVANKWAALLLVVLGVVLSSGMADYCSENVYPFVGSEGELRFTKQPTHNEYAIVGHFKELHCCAKGYRSIEWFKDGVAYPWSGQMILYPESANQTIYAHKVTEEDSGNYTCFLRNDATVYRHTVELKVYDNAPDDPQVTFLSKVTQAALGDKVRLFCEGFAGVVDLPDARNEAIWSRVQDDGDELIDALNASRIRQDKVIREEGQTFGTYLVIDEVTEDDFGLYVCKLSKPGKSTAIYSNLVKIDDVSYINPNPVPWKQLVIWIVVLGLVLLTGIILNIQFGLKMRVRMKDSFGQLETNDGKATDLLIVYAEKDAELALGVLLPTLESCYDYKCACRILPFNISTWYNDLISTANQTRRIIAVISPAALNDTWDAPRLHLALKQLSALGPRLTCIALKELPTVGALAKDSQGQSLASCLRAIQVLHWDRQQLERFWLALRLQLPSKRSAASCATACGGNTSRLTMDSQDNLEKLV